MFFLDNCRPFDDRARGTVFSNIHSSQLLIEFTNHGEESEDEQGRDRGFMKAEIATIFSQEPDVSSDAKNIKTTWHEEES
ncbi:MAG: hypothetical protein AB2401_06565 [Bacillus sp. (in: firmicutes)]|nr:hypothetical protein PAV_6c03650 [Paenibacillus alvei DSM 29]